MARRSRRQFLISSTLASSGVIATNLFTNTSFIHSAPAIVPSDKLRPKIPYGIASGTTMKREIIGIPIK
jgi:alkaline phosphatase D